MKVTVTAAHISNGHPGKAHSCAIALALREQCPAEHSIMCGTATVYLSGRRFDLPEHAAKWMARYDTEGQSACEPFAFDLPDTPAPPARRV